MPRPREDNRMKLSLVEVFQSINESFEQIIPTDFRIIDFDNFVVCRFESDSKHSYDVEFYYREESSLTVLNDGKMLGDYMGYKKPYIDTFDIGFTLSDIKNKDNPDEYEKETHLNEVQEVMGRITYICKRMLSKYKKVKLFVIGPAKRNKLDIYENMYYNNFANDFDLFYGKSLWHDEGNSMFLVRK